MAKSNELPNGWIDIPLETCVEILDEKRIPINSRARQQRQGTIPYYGATGQVGWIDDYLFDEELVLLGEDGAPFLEAFKNKAYLISGKSWINNHAHVLKGISGLLLNKFLCYYLNQINYHEYVNGTTRLKLNKTTLKTVPVILPPLNEQKRIVKKIDKMFLELNDVKSSLENLQIQLMRYRQSILNSVLSSDFFGDEKEYEQIPISQVQESLNQGWSPKCENKSSQNNDEWTVMTTTAIQPMIFDGSQNKILPNNLKPRPKLELKENDLLITRAGPRSRVGITCLVKKTKNRLLLCDKAYRIKFDTNSIVPSFFEIVLNSPDLLMQIEEIKTGTSDSGLNLTMDKFSNLIIPFPSKPRQHKIVKLIKQRFNFIKNIEKIISSSLLDLDALHQSVLKQAFEGNLVPQDPKDEPASKLLERIQLKIKNKESKNE